ncbi:MAG: TonB-dependent receptor [Bacteroidetes bacterium]|jgi:TonB-dependent receptor|nr:TonB-dependent receptor [Bacteroidota bacterium]
MHPGYTLRGFLIGLLLLAFPHLAHAQSYGSLTGVVTEAQTGETLPGANVVLEGTGYGTATQNDGTYRLTRVPAGTYTVAVSYIGYQTERAEVTIAGGETVRQDATLPAATLPGQEIVVLGLRAQGQAKALTQQKNAANITNVVAADQIGRFPDATAPEALQRVPAIGVQRDQGEGRFIQIRGAAPQFTTVTFNGERIPSPEGDVRQIALDAVPSEILEAIEVSKAITPDMDADAIGGSVNLVTRRAPDRRLLAVDVAGGYGPIRDQGSVKSSATFGTRSSDGTIGVLLSGTLNRRNFGSDNIEPEYDFGDDDAPLGGDDQLGELQVRYYDLTRQRIGLNGVLDYRASQNASVYLRGVFTQLQDTEQRQRMKHTVEDGELGYEHKNRTEFLRTLNLAAGGRQILPVGLQIDYQATFTRSAEETPEDVEIAWLQEDVAFAPSIDDPDDIRANPQDGALQNTDGFLFDAIEPATSITTNTDYVGAVDLTFPYRFGAQSSGTVKVGGKYRYKDKDQDVTERALELADGAEDIVLGQGNGLPFGDYYDGDFEPGDYPLPPVITGNQEVLDFEETFRARLAADPETAIEGNLEDFEATEQTIAAYAMTELNLTPRLLVLPGLRYERTDVESLGFESVVETEVEDGEVSTDLVGVREVEGENDYGFLFPMLHVRYRPTSNTNVRAALTTALARPNFFDLAPYRIQDDDEVEIGNPDLDPSRSTNLDLLVEHYTESIGVFSAGAFYKRVQDPIVTFRDEQVEDGTALEFIQSRNGASGWIWGIEVAAQQQLRFLPGALSGLGLYANYTYTQSEATLADGSTALFPGQADHIANAAVSYERGGFSGQLSLNYTGEFLDEFGGDGVSANRANDIFVQERLGLDANATYRFTSGLSVFLELLNLLNEPLELYQGDAARPIQQEFYQRWGWLGVKYSM